MKKSKKIIALLISCIMLLGLLPITVLAANTDGNPQPFSFEVDKSVVQGGDVTPGEETFTFELEYGNVGENEHHSIEFIPDDSVTLEDCGISFTNNTITTDGTGEQTFSLGGTVDLTKLDAAHHWQNSTGNDSVTKQIIVLRLTEKNDGKAGWTYSDVERYLTITVKGNDVFTEVGLLGNDVYDNNFENIYNAYSFDVKKTDENGNPLAGAVFSLTSTDSTAEQSFETVSGEDGIATFVVPDGNYILAEKAAPLGYVKSDDAYIIGVRTFDGTNWGGESGVYFYDPDEPDYSNYKYIRYEQVTFVNEAIPEEISDVAQTTTAAQTKNNEIKKSPNTGNNSMLGVSIALMFAAAGVAGTTAYSRKKKNSAK